MAESRIRDLLLEVGTEEIPARLLDELLEQLAAQAAVHLAAARLDHGSLRVMGTPRRLVLLVEGLAARQRDAVTEVKGPPVGVAFDRDGNPTAAARGFARNQGVRIDELEVRAGYLYVVRREPGRPAVQVLTEVLPATVTALEFARPMRWGVGETRFIRPIRWVLALLDDELVRFELVGVWSDRYTRGHRFLAPGPHEVESAQQYPAVMRRACVIVDPAERRRMVRRRVEAAARREQGRVVWVPGLLDEVNNLVEHPTAVVGGYDPDYLDLPREVLVTVMRHHQRCFPVEDAAGKLLPRFVAVRCGGRRGLDTVARGNAWVLRARLADARFFYQEDCREPLDALLERLQSMSFGEGLGTVRDRVHRIVALTAHLARELGMDERERKVALRAAELCKADLATRMVYEYPELAGVMGCEYARRSGEDPAVARAIYEHCLPRTAEDDPPASRPGAAVGLADRVDALVAFFRAGLEASGSQDPFGQRRLAHGVVRLLAGPLGGIRLDGLLSRAIELHAEATDRQVADRLTDFLLVRFRSLLADEGLRPDVVEAVLAAGHDPLSRALARARALERFRSTPAFADLLATNIRVVGLAGRARPDRSPDPGSLSEPAELDLYRAFTALRDRARSLLADGRYEECWSVLAGLRPAVDAFFDGVLVMAPDPTVRDNRLALLAEIAALINAAADLGRLSGEGQPGKEPPSVQRNRR